MKAQDKNSLVYRAKKDFTSPDVHYSAFKTEKTSVTLQNSSISRIVPEERKKAQYSGRMMTHTDDSLVYRAKKDYSHRPMCTILQLKPKEDLSHIAKQFYLVYCARRKKKKAQYSGRMKSHTKNSLVYRAKKDYSHRLICTFLKLKEEISRIATLFSLVYFSRRKKKQHSTTVGCSPTSRELPGVQGKEILFTSHNVHYSADTTARRTRFHCNTVLSRVLCPKKEKKHSTAVGCSPTLRTL
ncbi:hypothetical protein JTE90_003750 [Oedothorax gibbosus]|uniref:Uncharacterized protein n=1 Tax=Oedothorax gibbosus TaxID=931172 RepID=A0AAV6VD54_9ARAC|nr:hypothetical protein JTE90_003750 [Oedothorax gibbosus]